VFPVDLKAKEINVKLLSLGFVENSEDRCDAGESHRCKPVAGTLSAHLFDRALLPHNDPAKLPGPLQGLQAAQNCNAALVKFRDWFDADLRSLTFKADKASR
jgi:hypothetical protein